MLRMTIGSPAVPGAVWCNTDGPAWSFSEPVTQTLPRIRTVARLGRGPSPLGCADSRQVALEHLGHGHTPEGRPSGLVVVRRHPFGWRQVP